ncbi:cation channel sperm-associated protein subunit delta [Pteropus vampyrus]|uniref:Cation channel sperm-associated auxiliary subunit delta n=1 Tax=Pteropus vampyrus TaxID=132908 RepID=A0A6P6D573_PTEVA|nr:cation channel sperm-associated protein subunit delta [Pteropus vampyrus]
MPGLQADSGVRGTDWLEDRDAPVCACPTVKLDHRRLRCSGGGRFSNEMLVLMLVVAAATLRLCPLARAQPLCRTHTVRTGKVFPVEQQIRGDLLHFSSMTTRLIKHPCQKNIALYLGRQLFFTRNNFESSLLPLSIPASMKVGVPEVTSAHFADSVLLLVVNRKIYIYNYEDDFWARSRGIKHPVSHISGENCCYTDHFLCLDISYFVFAYLHGDAIAQTTMYFSDNQGYRFQKYIHEGQEELVGSLGGVFYLHSLSQTGLLLTHQGRAQFLYSDYPKQTSFQFLFCLVCFFLDENEMAVLTQENKLYYGSLGILTNFLIKFADQNLWSQEAVLMFSKPGILQLVTPIHDSFFPAFDFQKCVMNIQAILMDPQLQVDFCKVELLQGDFENKMYNIDMNSKLELAALMIPRPSTSPVPLVIVSNPHSLGLQAVIYENSHTYDGNIEYKLNISLRQQQHYGRADPSFTSRPSQHPHRSPLQTALISIGCDLEKKIVIRNEISACNKGILDPVTLQNNYSYVIEKGDIGPLNWDRENYVSCRDPNNHVPLKWPDVPYQILGGPTDNKVTFDQRNGFYIFLISIVDPYYSYCHLETIFSVYVYGAFPLPMIPPEITIILLMLAILLSVWLAYMIPKVLRTEWGHRVQGLWASLGRTCVSHAGAAHALKRPRIVSK